jgi:8-oxo-dGTP pyrophosphatase MutT (NUDIX family)
MIFLDKPETLTSVGSIVACFLEHEEHFLFLKRSEVEQSPGTWCVPGGKLEQQETPIEGARRELFEETQLEIPSLSFVRRVFLTLSLQPTQGLDMYIFYAALDEKLQPTLNFEHTEHKWMTFDEAKAFPLISGCPEHLDKYRELIKLSSCR